MPGPGAPSSKPPSPRRTGPSAGTSFAGSVIAAVARHWSIPLIRAELLDAYQIKLSDDAIAGYIQRYQAMLAARQQDPEVLRQHYDAVEEIVLSIDGLQPEKGHETLYVVRELTGKRIWFAEALLSATADEVRRLIAQAKAWAERLHKRVVLWISDKQDAFVTAIAAEFPDVPHRYCENHFLRDVAQPVLEADSHAKVQMRRKVRGLRSIERTVLKHQRESAGGGDASSDPDAPVALDTDPATPAAPETDTAGAVVLDYCAAVRGILNDDQGGPLQPPGLRMADALQEVRASIQRNLDEQKGDSRNDNSDGWPAASTADRTRSGAEHEAIRGYVRDIQEIAATLDPGSGTDAARRETFDGVDRPLRAGRGRPGAGSDGQGHDRLPGGPVRRRVDVRPRCGTTSIWSDGFACPRATSVGFTGTAMRGFASFTTDRRWCRPWMPT